MPHPRELPIYELENAVVASLRAQGRLIVQAPTGSGKSTQIPQMLWRHGLLEDAGGRGAKGEVVVLQPRRLAARMLAKRVAEEAGSALGDVVGYQIRLESRVSERTRIRFVTEGILLRQMSFDPTLRGVSAIVFDEFHERHLYGDISLARAIQIQQSVRPDLKIIVMSATLDAGALKTYLAPCDVLVSAWKAKAGSTTQSTRGNYRRSIFGDAKTKAAFRRCLARRVRSRVIRPCLVHHRLSRANLVDGMLWLQGAHRYSFQSAAQRTWPPD